MKSLLLLLIGLMAALSLAAAHNHTNLPVGGRTATHGMVLYGSGTYFLSHIPTTHYPHDFQIIAEVELNTIDDTAVTTDFSLSKFTLKPEREFSLNDFISGKLTEFNGSIHAGNFEAGAPPARGLARVKVTVREFKLIRKIPAQSDQDFIELSDGTNFYRVHIITPDASFQRIDNTTTGQNLWCVIGPQFFSDCPSETP